MKLFYIMIVLRSLMNGESVTFVSQPGDWPTAEACEIDGVPRLSTVVAYIVRRDPKALSLLGVTVGKPSRSYFVFAASCNSTIPTP